MMKVITNEALSAISAYDDAQDVARTLLRKLTEVPTNDNWEIELDDAEFMVCFENHEIGYLTDEDATSAFAAHMEKLPYSSDIYVDYVDIKEESLAGEMNDDGNAPTDSYKVEMFLRYYDRSFEYKLFIVIKAADSEISKKYHEWLWKDRA